MRRVAVFEVANPDMCPNRSKEGKCLWWSDFNHDCNRWSTISDKGVTYYEKIFPDDCPLTEMEDVNR